jgi:predicted phosphodiesterase
MSPRIEQLGVLSGPVWLFGGCYSNLQATQALLELARQQQLPPRQLICNGDSVAYCADPQDTVALLRHHQVSVVQGNCEQALAEQAPDCGCGFEAGSSCSQLAESWYRYSQQRIDPESRRWMAQLPSQIRFELNGLKLVVTHGGLSRNNLFLFGSSPRAAFEQELELAQADIVIAGHSGIPFAYRAGTGYWLNTGAIGMPANDGSRDGWYLVLESCGQGLRCRWQRLRYDAELAAERMRAEGLSAGYQQALLSGLWPSNQVLPETERSAQGQRLSLPELLIPKSELRE